MIMMFVFVMGGFRLFAKEPSGAEWKQQANVVIIHVDDLGWRDLAFMGSTVYETPHLDALAKSGKYFTDAYSSSPICTPSRVCLLTGSQPSRHGVYTVAKNRGENHQWKVIPENNNQFLAKDYPTIGTLLTAANIPNAAIGKWHVAAGSPSHGFEEGKYGGYLGLPINYFAPFKLGFLPQNVPDGSYLPTFIRDAGVDFLERHKNERFFLYFSTYLPHDEIYNKGEDPGAGSDAMFRLAAPQPIIEKYQKKISTMKAAGKDLQGHDNPIYAAMIEETDRSVGAIIKKLDALKLREKTLVIFISDNGGVSKYTSNLPLRSEKTTLYEGGIRVPMIVSMPTRIQAGKVSSEPVSGIDIYPTVCAMMGLNPSDPSKVDGNDLSALIFNEKSLGERNLFWNFPSYVDPMIPEKTPRSAMRRGDWKIIHRYVDNGYELYNIKNDIGETKDLSKDPTHADILTMMRSELEKCYDRFGAVKTLPVNPSYKAK